MDSAFIQHLNKYTTQRMGNNQHANEHLLHNCNFKRILLTKKREEHL